MGKKKSMLALLLVLYSWLPLYLIPEFWLSLKYARLAMKKLALIKPIISNNILRKQCLNL